MCAVSDDVHFSHFQQWKMVLSLSCTICALNISQFTVCLLICLNFSSASKPSEKKNNKCIVITCPHLNAYCKQKVPT